jgi:hypothetical protein
MKNQSKVIAALGNESYFAIAEAEKDYLPGVSKEIGVLCLSGRRDNILMWGHYCDQPRGLVIGFDKSHAVFRQGLGLRPVLYVKQRVCYNACWKDGSPDLETYRDQIILSKSADWSCECEFRQIFKLSSPSLVKRPLRDNTTGFFLCFSPEAIVSVTLGPRVSSDCESEVKEILQKAHFSRVKLDRAVLNKCDFELEFAPMA